MNMNFNFLDSKKFHNLMQTYRRAPVSSRDQYTVLDIFCEIKKYIKSEIWKQIAEEEEFRKDCEMDTN